MKSLWQKLLADETGVILSSEIALVGTVGVLGMVVGLEAVTSAVNSELNDFASAIGTLDQTFNFRSIAKPGHAFVRGAGFNDRGDFCDCIPLVQTDVFGKTGVGGFSENTGFSQSVVSQRAIVNSAPVVREQIIEERVVNEVLVEPPTVFAAPQVCPDDEIIEEHIIIRRRARTDCDCSTTTRLAPNPTVLKPKISKPQSIKPQSVKPQPPPKPDPDKIETKPKKKG